MYIFCKIILNEGSNQPQQPYALSRYRADVQSDQDLGYELSCIPQFIAIKTLFLAVAVPISRFIIPRRCHCRRIFPLALDVHSFSFLRSFRSFEVIRGH